MSHERYGEDRNTKPDPRGRTSLSIVALTCGLLLGLAIYLALGRGGDPEAASCAGGRDHGWSSCDPQEAGCMPRGLPCRTSAPRD